MSFKRVLCAVDFSNESALALRKAAELTRLWSGELLVVHALEALPMISQWLPEKGLGEASTQLEEKAHQAMELLLESLRDDLVDVRLETRITSGRGFEETLENARVWQADLIVLGARGNSSVEQVLMGSTAERVIEGSMCSVLVVKSPSES